MSGCRLPSARSSTKSTSAHRRQTVNLDASDCRQSAQTCSIRAPRNIVSQLLETITGHRPLEQLGILRLGFLENRDVRVGVLPERKKVLVRTLSLGLISRQSKGST